MWHSMNEVEEIKITDIVEGDNLTHWELMDINK